MDLLDPPSLHDDAPHESGNDGEHTRRRRAPGRRSRRMMQRRRQRRRERRQALVKRALAAVRVLAMIGVVAALVVVGVVVLRSERPSPATVPDAETPTPAVDVAQETLLLVRQDRPGGPAVGLTLLAVTPGAGASIVFLPASALVEIPGVGLDRLGQAQQYGGPALSSAAVANALGIELDGAVAITSTGLRALLDDIGGAELIVPERLIVRADDGTATIAFEEGQQFLPGIRLADYWSFLATDESELDTFPRQQAVLGAMLDRLADDPAALEEIGAADRLPPGITGDITPEQLAALLSALAEMRAAEALTFHLLPVRPLGMVGDEMGASYRLDDPGVAGLVRAVLDGSIPEGGGEEAIPIQVLNGVGRPGIGQQVDAALAGLGFRIALTENARSFDFTETQILIYDESAASRAAADRVRQALGVGRILVSRQPQSVVDLTIVVGADFVGGGQTSG